MAQQFLNVDMTFVILIYIFTRDKVRTPNSTLERILHWGMLEVKKKVFHIVSTLLVV
jgi:hypothetical protein